MGDVVKLKPNLKGNGAREAIARVCKNDAKMGDWLLAKLWMEGYRVVPVFPGEDPSSPGWEC